jgi:uncharacterized membrane protein YphA (DoxX/SURF4 family)
MSRGKRARLAAAWLLGLYLANMYIRMGWIKFDPDGFWTGAFERWGYPAWLRVSVGWVEVVGGAMLIVPWTATLGALAVAVVMGGAWLTRYLDGRYVDVVWISSYFVALLWIAYEWREFGFWRRHEHHDPSTRRKTTQ